MNTQKKILYVSSMKPVGLQKKYTSLEEGLWNKIETLYGKE